MQVERGAANGGEHLPAQRKLHDQIAHGEHNILFHLSALLYWTWFFGSAASENALPIM